MSNTNDVFTRIEEANLLVRSLKISPSVVLSHEKALSNTTEKYPLTRVEVKPTETRVTKHLETIILTVIISLLLT